MILEACVQNLTEAINAQNLGAHQIELCDRLDLDGTSPSLDTVKRVCAQLSIPVKVIVNPNPYNYNYSPADVRNIITYVEALHAFPVKGIVFGPLTKEGLPDLKLIKKIAEISNSPITFHKAIDISEDILQTTKLLAEQNIVKFILSSGGHNTAFEGVHQLLQMKTIVQHSDIKLMAAGKITSSNLTQLHEQLNLTHYHGKKIVGNLNSGL